MPARDRIRIILLKGCRRSRASPSQRGSLVNPLVTSIDEDREGILPDSARWGDWNRIDRRLRNKYRTPRIWAPETRRRRSLQATAQERCSPEPSRDFIDRDEKTGRLSPYLSHDSQHAAEEDFYLAHAVRS